MDDLIQDPSRDAWAAIRGYLYQVRMTVLRWLDLDEQTVLFCECGEDMNQLRGLTDSTGTAPGLEQLLEQVKHRERRITLRSPEVLRALADFYEARRANPGIRARFRYTSNAIAGREQGAPFPQGLRGIEAWGRVAVGTADAIATDATLEAIRGIVKQGRARGHSRHAREKLKAFKDFVASASPADLSEFLRAVEWALGEPGHDVLPQVIEKRLIESGLASPATAKRAADKLTIVALETLAAHGFKRLDRQRLRGALGDVGLSDGEQAILYRLQRLEEQVLPSLAAIQSATSATQQTVESLVGPIEDTRRIAYEMNCRMTDMHSTLIAPLILISGKVAHLDIPPDTPRPCAPRERLLNSLAGRLEQTTWMHIQGSAGMGKTHVARALGRREGAGHLLWISLTGRPNTPEQHVFDQLAAAIVKLTGDRSWWPAYQKAQVSPVRIAEALLWRSGRGTLVIVDDLPDLVAQTRLGEVLGAVAAVCRVTHAKLLTTGQRPLTPEAKASLTPSSVSEILVPVMDADDVLSMLQDAGAVEELVTPKLAEFLAVVCHGHPALLSAAIRWLEAKAWKLDQGALGAIIGGAATADERETAVRQLTALVSKDDERELLYRLSLVGRGFQRAQVEAVAGVDPVLARPEELLTGLVGPWVNRLAEGLYEVSPLLSHAGHRYLLADRVKAVSSALAQEILGRRSIGVDDAFFVASHLYAAQEWQRLAALLFQVMSSVRTPGAARGLGLLRFFFAPGTWPEGIPHESRIVIRSLQVKIGRMAGEDVDSLDDDLEALIATAGATQGERFATWWALMTSGPLLPQAPPGKAMARALQAIRMVRSQPGVLTDIPPPLHSWEIFCLMPMATVKDLGQTRDVLAVMEGMTSEELCALARLGVTLLGFVDGCWLHMSEKPKEEQDWDAVIETLVDIETLGEVRECEALSVMAIHARAIAMANYADRRDEAFSLLQSVPELADPDLQFLLRYTVACLRDDMGDAQGYIAAYREAMATGGDRFVSLRFGAHVRATVAAGQLGDWASAAHWARAGLRYGRAHSYSEFESRIQRSLAEKTQPTAEVLDSHAPTLDMAELFGELATALWYGGRRRQAWAALQGAVRHLDAEWNQDDSRYREVFRKAGHCLGWFSAMCAVGAPPASAADGTPYAPPAPGMFAWRNPRLSELSTPLSRAALWYQLGLMAAGLLLRQSAVRHLSRSADLAGEEGLLWLRSTIQHDRATVAAALHAFDVALEAGLEAVKGLLATTQLVDRGEDLPTSRADPDEVWQELPEDRRKSAQRQLFWLVVAPALASALARREKAASMRGRLRQLQAEFEKRRDELLEPQHWETVVNAAVCVWEPVRREQLVALVNDLAADEMAVRMIYYLAVSENEWFPLGHSLKAQSIVLGELVDREVMTRTTTLPDFCKYLTAYWQQAAESRGFQLRMPRDFRERMAAIKGKCDLACACQVLLWAEEGTGSLMPDTIRMKLREHSLD